MQFDIIGWGDQKDGTRVKKIVFPAVERLTYKDAGTPPDSVSYDEIFFEAFSCLLSLTS